MMKKCKIQHVAFFDASLIVSSASIQVLQKSMLFFEFRLCLEFFVKSNEKHCIVAGDSGLL